MPVFCITADYTPAALTEMRNNPTDRRQAAEQFAEAAGGKVLAWYGTMTNGPGVLAIYEVPDLATGPAMAGVAKSSGVFENVRLTRLFSMEEVAGFRKRAGEIAGSYKSPTS